MTESLIALALVTGLFVEAPSPCSVTTIGLDPTTYNSHAGSFLGATPGQTFLATDTLILALRVWRASTQSTSLLGMHLYITKTDSTGFPLVNDVVLDGPTLVRTSDYGTVTLFEWVFEPAVALPRSGLYAFFLRQEPCVGTHFDLRAREDSALNLYPDGHFWHTWRAPGCFLRDDPTVNETADLIFQIDFCSTAVTPVRRKTWGELKLIYL